MVRIEIDGKELEVPQGQMIIEAADAVGIAIPRFCYHKKLSIAANCRMCLVDVANAPKALPACATPVSEGMKVFTHSKRAREAQQAVMEFLLINHPLDCPICDQGGQCELQDVAMSYGRDSSNYVEGKRAVKDKNLGPLIATEMTRCIHCTRCVRFGDEIAGVREMGATGRGEFMEIGTYVEQSVNSELSGNIIDLCPVGALTSKPFRFKARAWEMQVRPSVSPHDVVGSHLYFHVHQDKVMRALPKENEALNEVWLSDRDRFSYEGFNHEERLTQPMIKKDGEWQVVDWEQALQFTAEKLGAIAENDPQQMGALASPNSTLEEFYLLQKLMRSKGCHNVDHRLRHTDFTHDHALPPFPTLGISLPELAMQEGILLVGCDIRKEQPLIAHRIRKATLAHGEAFAINPLHCDFNFEATQWVVDKGDLVQPLLEVVKAVLDKTPTAKLANAREWLAFVVPSFHAEQMAEKLMSKTKTSILLGQYAITHPEAHLLYWGTRLLASLLDATWGEMSFGANGAGGWVAGMIPGEAGLNAAKMWEEPRKAYVLMHAEPEFDCADPLLALKALKAAEFVVMLSAFDNAPSREYADVLLPVAPMTETRGTYINGFGQWQSFFPAVKPSGESKPGWKVLRVLANLWHVPDFDYNNTDEIIAQIKQQANDLDKPDALLDFVCQPMNRKSQEEGLVRLAPVPLYAGDAIVRRAKSLQQTKESLLAAEVRLNSSEAAKLKLKADQNVYAVQGEGRTLAPLKIKIDEAIPNGAVLVPASLKQTQRLSAPFTKIELVL